MIIVGAQGFAKELLEIFFHKNELNNIAFFDDINLNSKDKLYDIFPILKSETEVLHYFSSKNADFTIGVGNPVIREKLFLKFISLGGVFKSTISKKAIIGSYDVSILEGCNILDNAIVSNSVKIGRGCILYYNTTVTHDCVVGDFVELSPGATLLGRCKVDSFTQIGANATILPKINIGKNVILGAGSVVTKDIPDNCVAVGVPAKIIKYLEVLK